jgi:putative tricarboxylic transport membrane protein
MDGTTRRPLRAAGLALMLSSTVALAACSDDGGSTAEGGGGGGEDGGWTPTEQITMVSAFGAGGGTDKIARAMLAGIEECADGVTGNVEYHEGGSGVVGYTHFMQQSGDHQLMATTTELTTLPMFVDTPFTWESYTPIAQVADDQVSIAVPADSEFENLEDLVEAAKDRTVTVGVVGLSGPDNIVRVLLEDQEDITLEPVIFDGGGETTAALLGGDVDAAIGGAGDIVGQVESGDIRALAIFGDERYEDGVMADVPTAAEQGYDISFTQWRGLLGAPDMSDEAVEFYASCLEEWQDTPAYDEYIETSLATPAYKGPEEFTELLKDQDELVFRVLDESGAFDQ